MCEQYVARAARPNEPKPEPKLDLEINPAHPIITRLEAMRQASEQELVDLIRRQLNLRPDHGTSDYMISLQAIM